MMYEIKATEIVSVTTGFLKTGTPGTGSFDGTSPTEISSYLNSTGKYQKLPLI